MLKNMLSHLELKNAVKSALTGRFGANEAARPNGKVRFIVTREPYTLLTLSYMHTQEPKKRKTASKATEAEASPTTNTRTVFEEGSLGKLHKLGESP